MLLTQPRRPPFPSFPLAHAASFTKEPRDTSRSGSDKCVFGKVSSQTQAAVGPGQRNIWMISARIYIYIVLITCSFQLMISLRLLKHDVMNIVIMRPKSYFLSFMSLFLTNMHMHTSPSSHPFLTEQSFKTLCALMLKRFKTGFQFYF